MYRVLIADNQPVYRVGLKAVINAQPKFNVVAEVDDATDAYVKVADGAIDLVVMAISMPPGECGVGATRRIHEDYPDVKILINTSHDEHHYIDDSLHYGATGYVLKDSPESEFIDALTTVAQNHIFVDQNIVLTPADFERIDSVQADEQLYYYNALSSREREILPLMVLSWSNKEIASRLYITTKTVEAHKSNIMRKLNYPSHAMLVKYALKNSLVNF
ncbi:response regulator transcription factor [Lactobacillus sp. LC28-10]|uniref:Response regulator transcription factor n=1 Tax=Secundilactobacillus angelensis TaxID=2722706 RepID=A0ABX1L0V1_9LACO|nr:response regulator transcription factor [Secundilactobacillus angelensis]MCH5462973.1 response regulator transcription factor [Secundilactobacillus angelensis]NLR18698.1 response regulator transcription factor [Secundilactobacillus angelensis]